METNTYTDSQIEVIKHFLDALPPGVILKWNDPKNPGKNLIFYSPDSGTTSEILEKIQNRFLYESRSNFLIFDVEQLLKG